jgi:hypothetical protein
VGDTHFTTWFTLETTTRDLQISQVKRDCFVGIIVMLFRIILNCPDYELLTSPTAPSLKFRVIENFEGINHEIFIA